MITRICAQKYACHLTACNLLVSFSGFQFNYRFFCLERKSANQKKLSSHAIKRRNKKLQNALSDERLRKDHLHFLEIAQGPFQRKIQLSSLPSLIINIKNFRTQN